MAMQLKLDADGHAVLQEGKPVYIHDDGKEVSFDVPDMYARMMRDGKSTGELRKLASELQDKLKTFDGIDPEAARKAIETTSNLDSGKLLTAGKAEEVRAAANRAAEEKVASVTKTLTEKLATTETDRDRWRSRSHQQKIDGAFANSKYISEKVAVPIDFLRAMFAPRFSINDDSGEIEAKAADGQPIPSHIKFGDKAGFEEAIASMIEEYPHKDQILKGANHSGSGARPGAGGANGGKKTITRADFAKLDPAAQRAAAIGKDAMTIVD